MSIASKFLRSIWSQTRAAAAAARITREERDSGKLAVHLLASAEILVTGKQPYQMATYRKDRVIGHSVRTTGLFEENAILQVLAFTGLPPNRTVFLDVGANIGTHSLFALQNGFGTAVCIEPEPDNFMLLRINQILNGVDSQCVNINAAASNHAGEQQLELSETNFGDHRIRAVIDDGDNRHNEQARRLRTVKAAPLDALIAEAGIVPEAIGLAWIDTQGYEGQVLAGAKSLLNANVPIVLEFWPYGLKRTGGYGLLRAFLAEQDAILDIRKPLSGQTPLTLEELDGYFDEWVLLDKNDISYHTDLLLMTKQG